MSRPANVYPAIPSLREILPSGGVPGLTYAYIATKNLIRAQEDGYDMIRKPGFIVTNHTTGNSEGVVPMAKGKASKGLSSSAGARKVLVDNAVEGLFTVDASPEPPTEQPLAADPPRVSL